MDEKRLTKFIECSKKFENFDVYTSCEAHGKSAELIRSGLYYDQWLANVRRFATEARYTQISVMMTISSLCLFSITEFLDDIVSLKKEFNNKNCFNLSVNILRFPSFQSVNLLPQDIKDKKANDIQKWIDQNADNIKHDEINQLSRLVAYLTKVDRAYEDSDQLETKQQDFVNFFEQYTTRRKLNIVEIINDDDFTDWWKSLQNV
jgi:hypothetical protein